MDKINMAQVPQRDEEGYFNGDDIEHTVYVNKVTAEYVGNLAFGPDENWSTYEADGGWRVCLDPETE